MGNLTQDDCKNEFKETLDEFLSKLDLIDRQTPYSVSEPEWWLKMSALRRELFNIKKSL